MLHRITDIELGLKRDGDKFKVVGQDRFSDGTLSTIIQNLGEFDDPVDALIHFNYMQDPLFAMQVNQWTPEEREASKAKVRETLMTSNLPKIAGIRVKLGLSEHPITDIRRMTNHA